MYEKKKSISKIVISHLNMYPFFVAVLYGLGKSVTNFATYLEIKWNP